MAAGAHVTSANLNEPSIFEVIAQERLTHLIPAALTHAANVLYNRHPVLATIVRPDYVVLAAHSALEAHFLIRHNASAGEHFYGLERVNSDGRMTRSEKLKSLILISVLPLIQRKLSEMCDDEDDRCSTIVRGLRKVYPYLRFCVQSWDFILCIRYLMGKTQYQSVEQLLSGTVLRRARPVPESKLGLIRVVSKLLSYSVTSAVFFIQFFQWWQNQDTNLTDDSPIPVPPTHLRGEKGPCPICGNDVTNAAVLSTSGFIFCYPCIHRYLVRFGKCPMTRYPSTVDCLIRLHTEGS